MNSAKSYQDLDVWRLGMELVVWIYQHVDKFPARSGYSLAEQMRRAAVSIPSNIAEGQARYSKAEFRRFLLIARGSFAELNTQVRIAGRLEFLSPDECAECEIILDKTGRMLNGLLNSLK